MSVIRLYTFGANQKIQDLSILFHPSNLSITAWADRQMHVLSTRVNYTAFLHLACYYMIICVLRPNCMKAVETNSTVMGSLQNHVRTSLPRWVTYCRRGYKTIWLRWEDYSQYFETYSSASAADKITNLAKKERKKESTKQRQLQIKKAWLFILCFNFIYSWSEILSFLLYFGVTCFVFYKNTRWFPQLKKERAS